MLLSCLTWNIYHKLFNSYLNYRYSVITLFNLYFKIIITFLNIYFLLVFVSYLFDSSSIMNLLWLQTKINFLLCQTWLRVFLIIFYLILFYNFFNIKFKVFFYDPHINFTICISIIFIFLRKLNFEDTWHTWWWFIITLIILTLFGKQRSCHFIITYKWNIRIY